MSPAVALVATLAAGLLLVAAGVTERIARPGAIFGTFLGLLGAGYTMVAVFFVLGYVP